MACDSRDVPPGGLWRGAGRGEERRGGVRDTPVSRRVGSVTSPQRPAGPRGARWHLSLRGSRDGAGHMAAGAAFVSCSCCRQSCHLRPRPPAMVGDGEGARRIPSRGLGTLKWLGQEGTPLWVVLGVKGPGCHRRCPLPSPHVSAGRASARGQELLAQVTAGDRDRKDRRTGGLQGATPLGVWVPWGEAGMAFGHLGVTWAPWRVLAPGTPPDTSPRSDQGTLG